MIDPKTQFPGNWGGTSLDYPYGTPRDVTAPGAGDGSAWEENLVKDIVGAFWAILAEASPPVVPNGTPETAQASQLLTALQSVFLQRVGDFNSPSTPAALIPQWGVSRYPENHIAGLLCQTTSRGAGLTKNVSVEAGACRGVGNTVDIELASALSFDADTTWTDVADGGLAEGATWTQSTVYPVHVARSDDLTKVTAFVGTIAEFYGQAASTAAGYTDTNFARRVGWIVSSGSGSPDVLPFFMRAGRHFIYEGGGLSLENGTTPNIPNTGSRDSYDLVALGRAPKNTHARFGADLRISGSGDVYVLFSEDDMVDGPASVQGHQLYVSDSVDEGSANFSLNVPDSGIVYARAGGSGTRDEFYWRVIGWQDTGAFEGI